MKLLNKMVSEAVDDTTSVPSKQKAKYKTNRIFGASKDDKALPYESNTVFVKSGGRRQSKKNIVSYFSNAGNLMTPTLRKSDILKIIATPQLTAEQLEEETRRAESEEFAQAVNNLHRDVQMAAPEEPFTFPDTEYNFNLQEAVQASIANYKRAKNKFNVSGGGVSRLTTM
jgi:hypothetical protein